MTTAVAAAAAAAAAVAAAAASAGRLRAVERPASVDDAAHRL